MEIDGDELFFQAISRAGQTVDSGSLRRTDRAASTARIEPDGRPALPKEKVGSWVAGIARVLT